MKPSLSLVIAAIISLAAAVFFLLFIRLPQSSLWRGYNILCVPSGIAEESVLGLLEEEGVAAVVSLSRQHPPLVSQYAPVQTIVNTEQSYLRQRTNYFFDRSREMRLYYVPDEDFERASQVAARLKHLPSGAGTGLEGGVSYPWIAPLVVGLALAVLVVLSKSRRFVLVAGFFPLLFTCCVPSYSGAGAAVLLMYGFFLCGIFWGRKDMVKAILRNPLVLLFLLSGIPVAFLGSRKEGLLFLVCFAAAISLCFILSHLSARKTPKTQRFAPVPIRSARIVSVVSSVASFTLFIPAVAAAVLSVALFFFGYFPADTSINGLFLPAPARYTDTMSFDAVSFQDKGQDVYLEAELPSLVHYVDWVWDTLTYPYRSLHETQVVDLVAAGETVTLPSYERTEEGIRRFDTAVYTLDDEFISSVLEGIGDSGGQIECVLKTQNCFTSVVYRRMGGFLTGDGRGQVFVMLSLLATITVSLAAGIFIWRTQK